MKAKNRLRLEDAEAEAQALRYALRKLVNAHTESEANPDEWFSALRLARELLDEVEGEHASEPYRAVPVDGDEALAAVLGMRDDWHAQSVGAILQHSNGQLSGHLDADPCPPHDELAQHALEAAEEAMLAAQIAGDTMLCHDALALVRQALERDPRTHGTPQTRIHWLHIKDGDKMIWELVAELRSMHRDVDGLIAHLADQAGVEPPTSARLQALREELRRVERERDECAAHIVCLTAERDELRALREIAEARVASLRAGDSQ